MSPSISPQFRTGRPAGEGQIRHWLVSHRDTQGRPSSHYLYAMRTGAKTLSCRKTATSYYAFWLKMSASILTMFLPSWPPWVFGQVLRRLQANMILHHGNYYQAKTVSPYHALVALDEDGDIRMCPEVATALRLLLPAPKKASVPTEDRLPEAHHGRPVMVYEGEQVVFAELRQVLALARSGQIAVSPKKGAPTESAVKKIGEALAAPDFALDAPPKEQSQWYDEPGPVRAFAWGFLVQACGWCKAKGGKLVGLAVA